MTVLDFSKELVVNRLLGVAAFRRLVDALSARPALAPVERDADDIWSDPFHPELPLRKWRRIRAFTEDPDCARGKTVVEIGPGMSLGMGVVAIALGARRCILADCEQYVTRNARSAASHRELLALLPTWIPGADPRYRTCIAIDGDEVRSDGELLRYEIAPAERLPFAPGSIDLIVSYSTLEHIRDLDRAVAELARVTRAGGRGVHQVDLADHLNPDDPLRMLSYSARSWDLIASNRRGWTNRLRLPDHLVIYEKRGFTVEKLEVIRALPAEDLAAVRFRLAPDLRSLPDEALRPLGFICVLKR